MRRFDNFRKGVFYEPRALWEVVEIQADSQQNPFFPLSRQQLTQPFWRNGSRHTIVLTHFLYTGVNYLLQENAAAPAVALATYNNASSVINRVEAFLSAPGRVHFSGEDIIIPNRPTEPTSEPSMRFSNTTYASGLYGLSRWDFDFPMWIPRLGRVRLDVSPWLHPNVGFGAELVDDVFFTLGVFEEPLEGYAERIPATGRFTDPRQQMLPSNSVTAWPQETAPFPADAFGALAVGVPQGTNVFWNHRFVARDYDSQEADRGTTHKRLSGFGVAIDQIAYDDRIQNSGTAGVAGQPITPLSQRVATRARTDNGGSKEWWWRPGAPLALVAPTIGPAAVHKLEDPIVLGQGDSLDVELQVPLGSAIPTDLAEDLPTYQIGVSALGYAMIEG